LKYELKALNAYLKPAVEVKISRNINCPNATKDFALTLPAMLPNKLLFFDKTFF